METGIFRFDEFFLNNPNWFPAFCSEDFRTLLRSCDLDREPPAYVPYSIYSWNFAGDVDFYCECGTPMCESVTLLAKKALYCRTRRTGHPLAIAVVSQSKPSYLVAELLGRYFTGVAMHYVTRHPNHPREEKKLTRLEKNAIDALVDMCSSWVKEWKEIPIRMPQTKAMVDGR